MTTSTNSQPAASIPRPARLAHSSEVTASGRAATLMAAADNQVTDRDHEQHQTAGHQEIGYSDPQHSKQPAATRHTHESQAQRGQLDVAELPIAVAGRQIPCPREIAGTCAKWDPLL